MLRLDPSWDISIWLDERAKEELQLIEGQLVVREIALRATFTPIGDFSKTTKEAKRGCGRGYLERSSSKKSFRCL